MFRDDAMPPRTQCFPRKVNRVWLFLAVILLCTERAIGQETAGPQPFALPGTAPLLCRSIPVGRADSASFVYQFLDRQAERGRESVVAFDSLGTPLYMTVFAPVRSAGTHQWRTYAIALRFVPIALGDRLLLPSVAQPDTPVSHEKPELETLSTTDLANAKTLAEWFWARRCKGAEMGLT